MYRKCAVHLTSVVGMGFLMPSSLLSLPPPHPPPLLTPTFRSMRSDGGHGAIRKDVSCRTSSAGLFFFSSFLFFDCVGGPWVPSLDPDVSMKSTCTLTMPYSINIFNCYLVVPVLSLLLFSGCIFMTIVVITRDFSNFLPLQCRGFPNKRL